METEYILDTIKLTVYFLYTFFIIMTNEIFPYYITNFFIGVWISIIVTNVIIMVYNDSLKILQIYKNYKKSS